MPVTSVSSDPEKLSLTIVGEYPVTVERLWEAHADPRQLERFFGPPGYPVVFTRHDFAVGGESRWSMTGPKGERFGGWWRFLAIAPHRRIEIEDGFSDDDGIPNTDVTGRLILIFEPTKTGSRVSAVSYYPDVETMERMVEGQAEGGRAAMAELDAILADLASFAASRGVEAQLLSDTQVRVSRVIRGSIEQVWRAHHDSSLMKRWLLGPDGWTMPVCEPATTVGGRYRYEWEKTDKSQRFGFEGELLESVAPYRAVTTEQVIGTPGPATRNELTLTAVPAGTLMSLVITYPSKELRDMILGTGMTKGMETSYARLEQVVLAAA
jgi:uncharacterized protein YndB with AHSA1/START domain